jgi:nucleolar protein 4
VGTMSRSSMSGSTSFASSARSAGSARTADTSSTTVFISSLPYTATTTDVLTHFSFIGPVRHGFVATDKASGKSKGVGYVTYSLLEDAERAVNELDGGEFGDKGRKIRVQWAEHRVGQSEFHRTVSGVMCVLSAALTPLHQPGVQERRIREVAAPKIARVMPDETASSEPVDPNAIRTLILSGLPSDLTKAVLWKKVRKTDDRVELQYPIEGEDNVGESRRIHTITQMLQVLIIQPICCSLAIPTP